MKVGSDVGGCNINEEGRGGGKKVRGKTLFKRPGPVSPHYFFSVEARYAIDWAI